MYSKLVLWTSFVLYGVSVRHLSNSGCGYIKCGEPSSRTQTSHTMNLFGGNKSQGQSQQQQSGGGGLMGKLNNSLGGGQAGERNEGRHVFQYLRLSHSRLN